MADLDVRFIEASILSLRPGDILALRVKQKLTQQQGITMRDIVKAHVPPYVTVMILDDDTGISVIRTGAGLELPPR